MSRNEMRRNVAALMAALFITAQFSALAQIGGFDLPLGGLGPSEEEAAESDEGAPEEGNPGCPDMEELAKLPPEARKVAGEAMQAGNSTYIMMTQGRDILGRSMEETGDVSQALRVIRDEAAFMSLECSSDKFYRSGICMTFTLQCIGHGGGGCDSCGRRWGSLFCKESLKKVKDEVPDLDEIFGEDSEWSALVNLAEQVPGSTLVQDANRFKDDFLNNAIDGPVDELCDSYFYRST